jgi:hypothetical protein
VEHEPAVGDGALKTGLVLGGRALELIDEGKPLIFSAIRVAELMATVPGYTAALAFSCRLYEPMTVIKRCGSFRRPANLFGSIEWPRRMYACHSGRSERKTPGATRWGSFFVSSARSDISSPASSAALAWHILAPMQRPHHTPILAINRWATVLSHEQQRLRRSQPFARPSCSALRQLRDLVGGIAQGEKLTAIRQRDGIVEVAVASRFPSWAAMRRLLHTEIGPKRHFRDGPNKRHRSRMAAQSAGIVN